MPKPLADVAGKPMFAWALASLSGVTFDEIIVVALAEHARCFPLESLLAEHVVSPYRLVLLDQITEGQLCTVMAARDYLAPEDDLLVTSCDTLVVSQLGADIARERGTSYGLISVCNLPGEQWSFARIDDRGNVVEVAEKRRISDHASTGIYYFWNSGAFLAAADEVVSRRETTRGEFYIIPLYQKLISHGLTVRLSYASVVWDMGTPAAKRLFEEHVAYGESL
jgi:NDP-sugar pyrophosphorylase family protein